jgi:hypothetical protein
VIYFLLPLPSKAASSSSSSRHSEVSHLSRDKFHKRPFGGKAFPKGGGKKGSGKGKKGKIAEDQRMPSGCLNKTPDGKRLCFGYNSSRGCEYATPGQKCMKGYHLCSRPNCFGKHTAVACTKDA